MKSKLDDSDLPRLKRMLKDDLTYTQIAERLGLSRTTIETFLRKYGGKDAIKNSSSPLPK